MKRQIFWSVFLLIFFLRLQMYEAIEAVFWQSPSYVLNSLISRFLEILFVHCYWHQFFDVIPMDHRIRRISSLHRKSSDFWVRENFLHTN